MPRVSVVIPAYNALPYLPETLDSALAQRWSDLEVVVVDNGSTDQTAEVVRRCTDPRVRLVSLPENRGISGGCNAGVQAAEGELVAMLEADDLWHEDKLTRLVPALDAAPEAVLAYSYVELVDAQGRRSGNVIGRPVEGDVRDALLEDVVVPCGSAPVVRRSALLEAGGWDESFRSSPDWELYVRLAKLGEFRVVPEALVGYRQHRTNTSVDWETTSRDIERILDLAYAGAGVEDELRRRRTMAGMTLYFGWKSLRGGHARQALELRDRAVAMHPPLRGSAEHRRLTAHARLQLAVGQSGYEATLTAARGVKSSLVGLRGGRP